MVRINHSVLLLHLRYVVTGECIATAGVCLFFTAITETVFVRFGSKLAGWLVLGSAFAINSFSNWSKIKVKGQGQSYSPMLIHAEYAEGIY